MPRPAEWMILLALAAVLGGAASAAAAADASAVAVTGGWFRALPAHLPAGGYFTARNSSGRDIAITGARATVCGSLMLHRSTDKGGMSSMGMVDAVTIPAGGAAAFAPGGYHLMCDNPRLAVGATVSVTLYLSNGSSVTAPFAVRGPTGK